MEIVPARGFREQVTTNFRDRVISFTLEDDFKKHIDKAELILNNNDGALMDMQSLALGVVFTINFGYIGALAPPRIMQCRKMKGAFRIGGLGAESAPNTTAGGLVTLELQSQVWDMNLYRGVSKLRSAEDQQLVGVQEDRQYLFIKKTVPEIVRELARTQGYDGTSLIVQDLDNETPLDRYVIPADFSAAEWIANQAKERGWVFAIDSDGLHFHEPEFEIANADTVELSWFRGDPDVISWELDGDLNVPQNVQVRGTDLRSELVIGTANGSVGANTPDRNVAEVGKVRNSFLIDNKGAKSKRLSPDLLISTTNPSRQQLIKAQRVINRSANKWKLKMTVVGNPNIKARRTLTLKNFGPLVDGVWFIRKAVHKYAANQVYITEIEAKRKAPGQGKFLIGVGRGSVDLRNAFLISQQ